MISKDKGINSSIADSGATAMMDTATITMAASTTTLKFTRSLFLASADWFIILLNKEEEHE